MRRAHLLSGFVLSVPFAALTGLTGAPAVADGIDGAVAGETDALKVSLLTASPGATVTVNTAACGHPGTARGDASAVGAGAFTLTPSAGLTATVGTFRVPTSVPPGTYEIVATCSDRRQVTGQLAITPAAAEQRTRSLRHALAYLGGLLSPDLVRTAGGIALGAAAARITWVLHRRVRRNEI